MHITNKTVLIPAPSFTLFNQDHVQVASTDLLREGPVVVSLFRGHCWPYCM